MDVSKASPADLPKAGLGTAPATDQRTPSPTTLAPPADHVDIRPLDPVGALQILITEVRAALALTLEAAIVQSPAGAQSAAMPQSPAQAAHELVQLFLQEIPEDASNATAWNSGVAHIETAIQAGMDRALGIVAQWRDVAVAAVDAVKETRSLFLAALDDGALNPLWLRPEWLGLNPGFHRFRRRRRIVRRRLIDPDYATQSMDDDKEVDRR